MTPQEFFAQFAFKPALAGAHGVEREYFLMDNASRPVPRSPEFLAAINDPRWTYELSACQAEDRCGPHLSNSVLKTELLDNQRHGREIAATLGLHLAAMEVAPADMPLTVYPYDKRYQELASKLPEATLRAACRVAGVHIHRGVRDMADAIRIYNAVVDQLAYFMKLGDHSQGERLRLYRIMAKHWQPPHYESPEHFFQTAMDKGFAENPRNCWDLVRISPHGTVELRMLGMTGSPDEIIFWVEELERLIRP